MCWASQRDPLDDCKSEPKAVDLHNRPEAAGGVVPEASQSQWAVAEDGVRVQRISVQIFLPVWLNSGRRCRCNVFDDHARAKADGRARKGGDEARRCRRGRCYLLFCCLVRWILSSS